MVHVLVVLGALHKSIGDEKSAEGLRLHNLHLLELALSPVKHFFDLAAGEGESGGGGSTKGLVEETRLLDFFVRVGAVRPHARGKDDSMNQGRI